MLATLLLDEELRTLVAMWPSVPADARKGALEGRARPIRAWIGISGLVDCVRTRMKAGRVVAAGLVLGDGRVDEFAANALAVEALKRLGGRTAGRRKAT